MQLRFAREPRAAVRIDRDQLGQHLQRDVAMEVRVASAINLAHGARTERGDDLVRADAKTRREANDDGQLIEEPASDLSASNSDSTSRRSASSAVAAARNASRSSGGRSTAA